MFIFKLVDYIQEHVFPTGIAPGRVVYFGSVLDQASDTSTHPDSYMSFMSAVPWLTKMQQLFSCAYIFQEVWFIDCPDRKSYRLPQFFLAHFALPVDFLSRNSDRSTINLMKQHGYI